MKFINKNPSLTSRSTEHATTHVGELGVRFECRQMNRSTYNGEAK